MGTKNPLGIGSCGEVLGEEIPFCESEAQFQPSLKSLWLGENLSLGPGVRPECVPCSGPGFSALVKLLSTEPQGDKWGR